MVQGIRDLLDAEEMYVLRWFPGIANISDALTKYNLESHRFRDLVGTKGKLILPKHCKFEQERDTWMQEFLPMYCRNGGSENFLQCNSRSVRFTDLTQEKGYQG